MSDPNTPSVPSVPPVPPVPEAAPSAPKYGEFAPVETGAPGPVAAPVAAPGYPAAPAYPAAPGYPSDGAPAAPPQPAYGQPAYGQPGYGQPAYGQPAYGQPVYGQPVYGQPGFGSTPAPKRRRTWDVVLTIVLLVLGLGGVLITLFYAWIFSDSTFLDEYFQQLGYESFNGDIGSAPAILIGSHVVLYLIAIGVSILLLVKKKIAFYVPLAIGVLAAIIFWVTLIGVFMSDPNFVNMYGGTAP